ncbi:hypothetical protein BD310DRAFT_601262 [Dichomitus squalens]|uniref:Uncharacterized protein n=1 Tax=Dichomitus squalens TaxID=114155 RepID=A0A4Q9PQS4_9APHY|nr:hypothetical protein BD310DRAFT_601262 [Dichomitus squalens]
MLRAFPVCRDRLEHALAFDFSPAEDIPLWRTISESLGMSTMDEVQQQNFTLARSDSGKPIEDNISSSLPRLQVSPQRSSPYLVVRYRMVQARGSMDTLFIRRQMLVRDHSLWTEYQFSLPAARWTSACLGQKEPAEAVLEEGFWNAGFLQPQDLVYRPAESLDIALVFPAGAIGPGTAHP